MIIRKRFISSLQFCDQAETILHDRQKAEQLFKAMEKMLKKSMEGDSLKRLQLEQVSMEYMSDVENKRTDIINSSTQQFLSCTQHLEKAFRDMRYSKQKTTDGIQSSRSETNLEFLLERIRIKEKLEQIDLSIQQNKSKADQEVSNCQEKLSQARADVFLYFLGTLMASAAGLLGFLRLFYS